MRYGDTTVAPGTAQRVGPAGGLPEPVGPVGAPRAPGTPWQADAYSAALRAGGGPLFLHRGDGPPIALDLERWCGAPDTADRTVLARCEGAVLDIGCGPGRLVSALAEEGVPVLGIDVSEAAVERTRLGGGPALQRSVFDPLPGEGRWNTALLMDGNIGIGGSPRALLARAAGLLAPDGVLMVETAPTDVDERLRVRVAGGRDRAAARGAAQFDWARVGLRALFAHAGAAGWRPAKAWESCGRTFAALRKPCPEEER